MTVQELIDVLSQVEDKTLPVFAYNGDIMPVDSVDSSLSDRIDLNLECE